MFMYVLLEVTDQFSLLSADCGQGDSEEVLGKLEAPKKFIIDTKAPSFSPGASSKQSVLNGMEKSLKDLAVDSVCSGCASLWKSVLI